MATHLLEHFLKPVGQLPITQADPSHATVAPVLWLGHAVASQVVVPQP